MLKRIWLFAVLALVMLMAPARFVYAQLDQGTITGVVQDPSGAVIGHASVTLTNMDEGQVLKSKTDGAGEYILFRPSKSAITRWRLRRLVLTPQLKPIST